MKTFEELKEELLNRAKNANACQNGYKMGLDAKNKADLLKAITANWFWVLIDARIVDAIYLEENFTEEELSEAGIYTRKCHEVRTVSFACGSATVKAYDDSYVEDRTDNIRPESDYAIVKDYYNHKIYIRKGKFEIIEV